MHASVALVLVSHDGSRWLPTVLDGIAAQRVAPQQVVAVDTGSRDESPDLLRRAFGEVYRLPAATGYPEAIEAALAEVSPDVEWLWLLHDDSTPEPGTLATLLEAVELHPDADIIGPKLREWPSLRRLLELGVTISATGRRETGLERGEYDQGQHDEIRTVLAVNTAGMLIRRRVLEDLGGFDPQLPVFGNDIDLGWRAAAAGLRTIVVPQAIVFHAEAAHRGLRRTSLTGRHTHFQERRAAIYTLLANARSRALPFQVVRLLLGTLLRMVGFLLARAPRHAWDEAAALVSVYGRPGPVRAARRRRRAGDRAGDRAGGGGDPRPVRERRVRALLAPPWLPYRHGLDFVGDVLSAISNQASDVAERRRAAAAERDPSSFAAKRQAELRGGEDGAYGEELLQDSGWAVRFLTNPIAVLLTVVVLVLLVAGRAAIGGFSGGGLAPTPDGAGSWWQLHLESWHLIGQGSRVPAPAYVLPLALLASLLGGSADAAITALFWVSLPLSVWGAWRLLRLLGRLVSPQGAPRWMLLWGATSYALVPLVSGAWGDGRVGTIGAAVVLPWWAHAALGFADPEAERRWRAAWRTGLLLALAAAFAPVTWLLALLLVTVVAGVALAVVPSLVRDRTVWRPVVLGLGLPVLLLSPWWLPALREGAGAALLLDGGRLPGPAVDGTGLLLGRLPGLGAPGWLGVVVPVLAVAALVPVRTRIPVLVCWLVAALAGGLGLVLSWPTISLGRTQVPTGLTVPLLVVQGALIAAAVLGAQGGAGALPRLAGRSRAAVRAALVAGGAVAAVAAAVGLGWFALHDDDAVHRGDPVRSRVPGYMLQAAERDPASGVLVLRGSVDTGVTYRVVRGDGLTVGEDEIAALTPAPNDFTRLVGSFVSEPAPETVARLAGAGIRYVVQPAPADPSVSAAIDASGGLSQASAGERSTRAWQIDAKPSPLRSENGTDWLRVALLVLQLGGLVVAVVQCAPSIRGREGQA